MAEETKAVVEREEEEAGKKALATQAIAEDAQKDLGGFLRSKFWQTTSLFNIIRWSNASFTGGGTKLKIFEQERHHRSQIHEKTPCRSDLRHRGHLHCQKHQTQ